MPAPNPPGAHGSSRRRVLGPGALPTEVACPGPRAAGLRPPSPTVLKARTGFSARRRQSVRRKGPFSKPAPARWGRRPTGPKRISSLPVCDSRASRDSRASGGASVSEQRPEAGPRVSDAAHGATASVRAQVMEPPRSGPKAQLRTTGGPGSSLLLAAGAPVTASSPGQDPWAATFEGVPLLSWQTLSSNQTGVPSQGLSKNTVQYCPDRCPKPPASAI